MFYIISLIYQLKSRKQKQIYIQIEMHRHFTSYHMYNIVIYISVKKRARLFAVLLLQADDDGQLGGEYAIE